MSQQPDIVLLKYEFVLQPDGRLRTEVNNLDPDKFLQAAIEANKDWAEAPVISQALKYLLTQLKALDDDFDKYIMTL